MLEESRLIGYVDDVVTVVGLLMQLISKRMTTDDYSLALGKTEIPMLKRNPYLSSRGDWHDKDRFKVNG